MMMTKSAKILAATLSLALLLTAAAQTPERVNLDVVEKIKTAGKTSQVMDLAGVLTNTYGARLTNSASVKAAGEYARKKLVEWKLTDVQLQPFNFGSGWTNDRLSIKVVSDPTMTFQAHAKPWTVGTPGPVTAEVVEGVRTPADLTAMKGKLRGKIVLLLPEAPTATQTEAPPLKRFSNDELAAMSGGVPAQQPSPQPQQAATPRPAAGGPEAPEPPAQEAGFFSWVEGALSAAPAQPTGPVRQTTPAATGMPNRATVSRFYFDEGVAAILEPGPSRFGALFAVTDTGESNAWKRDATLSKVPPQVVVAAEDYNKLLKLVQKGAPVSLQVDIKNTYQTLETQAFNVVGDIKGAVKPEETVVLGAHLDSWHIGKGATDNAAGVAVVMEAVRILKALALPMRRTVRIALFTGEEQGLMGSMAFVDRYYFNRPIRQIKAGHANHSIYFNVDNGTGAIRGVYLQGNAAIKPIFEAWMDPLKSLGMTTIAERSVGGTDHLPFDNIGLPAFQFIQDPIEYDARTHHSTQDTFDKLIKDDLVKNATIVASWVYFAANRDELMPRKKLPAGVYPAGSPVP